MKRNKYLAYCLSASLAFTAMTPMNIMAEEVILVEEETAESTEQESQTGDVKENGAEESDMAGTLPENQLANIQNGTDDLLSEGELVVENITVEDDLSDVPVAEYTAEGLYGTALMAEEGSTEAAVSVDWTELTEGSTVLYKYDAKSKTLEFKSTKEDGEALPSQRLNKLSDAWAAIIKEVEKVKIEEKITQIGNYNFANDSGDCPKLKEVILGADVTAIGDYAFMQVSSLTQINLDNVTKIGQDGFFKTGLTTVTVTGESLTLGTRAFGACSSLRSFSCKKLTDIPNKAFSSCSYLSTFCAKEVENLGESAFSKCTALKQLDISDPAIKSIGGSAFSNSGLEKLQLTEANLTFSSTNPFKNCNSLKEICYAGTSAQWTKLISNGARVPADTIIHCVGDNITGDVKEPTCTNVGIEEKTCEVCRQKYKVEIPALEHNYTESRVTKAATCVEAGIEEKCCGTCKHTVEVTINALGHTYSAYTEIKAATCEEAGIKVRCCTREGCGLIETGTINALGHDYGDAVYTEVKAATCEESGLESRPCTHEGCNKTEEKEIQALGHDYTVKKITTEATCAKDGVQSTICSRCQKVEKTEAIKATGEHQWSEWKITSKATVFAAEQQERSCVGCGMKESKAVGSVLAGKASLNAGAVTLKVKQSTSKLTVTGMANGDSVKSWKSSNTKVVKVEGKADGTCKLTAKKKGTAKIEIVLASGLKKTVTVKVQSDTVKTTAIKGLDKKVTLTKGSKKTLSPVIAPITSQQKVTYSTSNKKIVSVDKNGVITAKKAGTAKITVKSGSKKFVVTVTVPKTKTTKINVAVEASVKKGKTLKLKVTLNPTNSDEKITYTSSNKKIATVDKNGKIKGIKKGSVKITVKSGTQKETVKVTVK